MDIDLARTGGQKRRGGAARCQSGVFAIGWAAAATDDLIPMHLSLRPATRADASYLLALEEACMRGYAEALWGHWRPSATVETLDASGHEIIERDGEKVGCVAVTWEPDHLFIDRLYIAPAFQRQGIGAVILKRLSEQAATRGLPTKLSVLITNPADKFYAREGFIVESETPERRRMSKPVAVSR